MSDSDDPDPYEDIPDNLLPSSSRSSTSPPVMYDALRQKPNSLATSRISTMIPAPVEVQPPLPPPNTVPKRPPKPKSSSTIKEPPTPPPSTNEPIPIDTVNYTVLPDELTLTQLVDKHQDQFPIRVHVCKGFYGSTERFSVSEGDIFNIHFVKKTKVVVVRDCSKVDYRIALNSSVEFGVLHNPEGNVQKALDGYKYAKISDIIAISPLPKALRATVQFKGTAADNSVEKNEIFIVKDKEIKLKGNRKYLAVYSVTNSTTKCLFESCEGHFSTKPYDVRLFLPEILEHFPQPFPTTCYLFVNSETSQELPHHLTSSAVTLVGESNDLSLIASSNFQVEVGRSLLIEIPIDLDIEVQLTQSNDEIDIDQLYEKTDDLMKNIDLSKVVKCVETDKASTWTTSLQPGGKKGIELVQSTAMRHWSSVRIKKGKKITSENDNDGESKEQSPTCKYNTLPPTQAPPLAPKPSFIFPPTTPAVPTTPTVVTTPNVPDQTAYLTSVRADMKRMDMKFSKDLESLKDSVTKLSQNVEHLLQGAGTRVGAQTQPSGRERIIWTSVKQQNVQFLRTLDTVNMVRLLKAMGLEQYNQSIAQEHITGDVLVECTEAILEKELNIASKLHRVRLMKLIDGSHSAKGILSGEGPYGALTQ